MQGQRSAGSSFTETVDLNQGSVSNETGMNQSMAWNSMLNPAESRSSNYVHASADGNFTGTNAVGQIVRNSSRWDLGESSSSGNQQIQGIDDGLKAESGQYSWFGASSGSDARVDGRRFRPSNFPINESVSSGVGWNQGTSRPSIMHASSSSRIPLNINLNAGHMGSSGDSGQGLGPNACQNMYKLSGPQTEHMLTASASDNVGASSGDSVFLEDNDGGSTSSFSYWGSSCKRKALESTSGQSYPSGSSNCFQQGGNFAQHGVPSCFSASSSLSISSPPMNSPSVSPEQLTPGVGIGLQGLASDVFPPLSMTGIAESSIRKNGVRLNPGHHESGRFNLLSARNATRHSDVSSAHQPSRPLLFTDPLELRPPTSMANTSNNHPNQSHPMHNTDLSINLPPPVSWNGTLNSRIGGSSSSLLLSGDRGASLRDEADFGSTPRSSMERPMFIPPDEMRNLGQDPNNWNLSTGITSTSANIPSSSRFGASSGVRPFPNAWMPHHNPPAQNQQRLSEYAPWSLFPSIDTEAGGQRGPFPHFRSSPSSDEVVVSSGGNNQGHHPPYSRSALFMGVSGDDMNGWRALAADIDGRQRLVSEIRQVLNAMRRAENLRAEDYMFFDPFIDSVAELHDRHRDMRLDVDNMSYEELLALEERIGTVSTGLSEETIMKSMQKRKYFPIFEGSSSNLEPCCICQEEYVTGDNIGTLDCGHDFHPDCIKQWLKQKNLCPICKMTALGT